MAAPKTTAQYRSAILKLLVATDPKAKSKTGKAKAKAALAAMNLTALKAFYKKVTAQISKQQAIVQRAMGQATSQQQRAGVKKQAKKSSSRKKSHSSRGRGTARKRSTIKFKSKTGGMTTKPSQAKSMAALKAGLKKAGVKGYSGKSRAQLQAMATQAQRRKTTRTAKSSGKTKRTIGGVSPTLRKDYNRVRSLISSMRLASRLVALQQSGKTVPQAIKQQSITLIDLDQIPLSDPKDRYVAWLDKYRKVLKAAGYSTAAGSWGKLTKRGRAALKSKSKSRKSRKKSGRKSVKARWGAIAQQQRVPYYIAPAPKVRRKAPFAVRAIPGTGAPAFSTLDRAEQKRILGRLNGTAKSLRSKGAPRKVGAQALFNYYDKKGPYAPKSKKAKSQKRGAANRYW